MGSESKDVSKGSSQRLRSRILTTILSTTAIVLLYKASIVGPIASHVENHAQVVEGSFRAGFLVISLVLGCWVFVRMRKAIGNAKTPPKDPIFDPDPLWLADLQKKNSLPFSENDKGAGFSFVQLSAEPERYRSRVVETIELAGRAIRQRVTVEFEVPEAALGGKYLYLPVLQALKGELVDNFYLTDASGRSLPNLSYEETTKLAAMGLSSVLYNALGRPDQKKGRRALEIDQQTRVFELVLLGIIAKRGRVDRNAASPQVDTVLSRMPNLSARDRKRLRAYVLGLSASYPIVAIVPTELVVANRVMVKYERDIIPSSKRNRFMGEVRLGLGLRPKEIAVPVELALSARSYHLRLNGPPDKYILRQAFECRNCRQPASRGLRGAKEHNGCFHAVAGRPNGPVKDSHFRLRRKRGQNYIHLYMRGYSGKKPLRGFQVRAEFKEVPPGSRANAMVTALATTVLIGIFGYLVTHHLGASTSGFPGLVLALPTIAASWFGFASDGGKLMGSSLLARLSLMVSGTLSLTALAAYLLHSPPAAAATGSDGKIPPVHHMIPIMGMGGLLWPVIFGLSTVNFIYTSWRFAMKLYLYKTLIQKSDTENAEYFLPS